MKKSLILFSILIFISLGSTTVFATLSTGNALITPTVLENNLSDPALVILDIRGKKAYDVAHIPSSIYSDYGKWRVSKQGVPGYLPEETYTQSLIQNLGIDKDSYVVVVSGVDNKYDFGRAARVYWTLKVSGISSLFILDGGIGAWKSAGLALSSDESPAPSSSQFVLTKYDYTLIETDKTVLEAVGNQSYGLVDARPKAQFDGYAKHPVAKRGGTIKGAKNISQFKFINRDGTIKSKDEIEKIVKKSDIDTSSNLITFCNTGHWAATDWFVLSEVLGYNASLYDGSLVDWTKNKKNPLSNVRSRRELKAYNKKS